MEDQFKRVYAGTGADDSGDGGTRVGRGNEGKRGWQGQVGWFKLLAGRWGNKQENQKVGGDPETQRDSLVTRNIKYKVRKSLREII